MTRYDTTAGHPLAGVPQAILDVARQPLRDAATSRDVDPEMADSIADAVVLALRVAGYVIRPAATPSQREVHFTVGDVVMITTGALPQVDDELTFAVTDVAPLDDGALGVTVELVNFD